MSEEKPYAFKRVLAYLFDILLVAIVASLLSTPFMNSKKVEEVKNNYIELVQKSTTNEIDFKEYTVELMNIEYQMFQVSGMSTIMKILVGLLYFVVFQLFNKGQTIGKKLMKIKVVSQDGELSMNQLLFRSFIANAILFDIISVIFILFASRSTYFYCILMFSLLQYIITIISFCMIVFGKKGLAIHDLLVHTKVIKAS